jgi:hypothetical protein
VARRLSHWRHGGNPSDWPTQWPSPAEHWPSLTPHEWIPDHEGGAVIVCIRPGDNGSGSVFTGYPDRAAAATDDAKRDGCCSLGCLGRHVIVWTEAGRVRVLLDLPVAKIPFPKRLIDVCGNRLQLDSPGMAFEYYKQVPPRVNNAEPVPDLGTKPTSTLTVQAVTDRCRVIAHLSDYMPIRVYWNFPTVTAWLYDQLFQCVLDAIEQQVISGNGSGENMLGILNVAGTTDIAFETDVPTTLRSAVSAMQNLGETPSAWVMNPQDAQSVDLTRWGAGGGFLSGGYEHDTGNGFGTSANIFGPDSIARVVTPHVPAGTALLADWSQLLLVFQQYMRLDSDTYSGFDKNSIRFRAESFVGIGILRPQAFAVVTLT